MSVDLCETISESQEFNLDWHSESTVEESTGIIRKVPLCGNRSKNGYDIPPAAFGNSSERVQALYENKPVCINHSSETVKGRGLEEVGGYIRNARFENGRPWGDIYTEGCPQAGLLLGFAKSKVPNVGLSHVARYRFAASRKAVESVQEVYTVDAVLFPATNKNFQEQDSSEESEYMSGETVELLKEQTKELRENFAAKEADLAKQITDLKAENAQLEASLKEVKTECDKAKASVASYEAAKALADRQAKFVESCKAANLDPSNEKLCPKSWLKAVSSLESEEEQKKAIAEHAELLNSIPSGSPTSQERHKGNGGGEWKPESVAPRLV